VEEHIKVEMDLELRSGGAGVVGGGPATELCSWRRRRVAAVGLGHGGDVLACWESMRLGEVVQELPQDDVVLLE
jgi:hypothetical protein